MLTRPLHYFNKHDVRTFNNIVIMCKIINLNDIKSTNIIISEIKYNLTQLFQIYIIQRYNNIAQTN